MAGKERLDILIVNRNLADSIEIAKAYIMSGIVYVDGIKEDKAGTKVPVEANIDIKHNELKYVSRGGLKLEKAVNEFKINLKDKICMDVGASTGGFTDCMLQNGAAKVYSIDVGYGQFAWKLRNDSRVVCMEKTNIRYVTCENIPDKIDFVSIDVSFISLVKVIPAVISLMNENGEVICLIKPQFEAERQEVGKKGVVKDKNVHCNVIKKIIDFSYKEGLSIYNIDFSPVKGPEGNIEYLIFLKRKSGGILKDEAYVLAENIVNISHESLL